MLTVACCVAFATPSATLARQDAHVPTPAETPVELVVSGRTSTLRSIVVAELGEQRPPTFAGIELPNVERFRWFASRHYALQTDYDAARAKHLLTLLELAYPHYVALFGREVPGSDAKRQAVVYGSSAESLDRALKAAGIAWDFGGGGITYEGVATAYQYPSGTLQYHQRYILLHECAHLFQIELQGTPRDTPSWWYEGVADALAHHVWESAAARLTVSVVDKPTANDWLREGLDTFAREPFTASDVLEERRGGRALGFLLAHYFDTDPERAAKLAVWRDELFRAHEVGAWQAHSRTLLGELFGADALERGFAEWLAARRSSFRYVDWGFEQDGDALMSYGWPQTGAYSQTDLAFPPGERAVHDPLSMDWPLGARSPLVGPVARGGDEPTVGLLVGFRENPDSGVAGLALGVAGREFASVLVRARRELAVDLTALGGERRTLAFDDAFVAATAPTGEIGLTVRLGHSELVVTARAGDAAKPAEAVLAVPLGEAARARLLAKPLAVLSRDGKHWLTPFVDDARKEEPDLSRPAPPNRWRTPHTARLEALARAAWRLGASTPAAITELSARLAREPEWTPAPDDLERVRAAIRASSAPAGAREEALAALAEPRDGAERR